MMTLREFLIALDDDMSKWSEQRKRPESSPIKHRRSDFVLLNKKKERKKKEG